MTDRGPILIKEIKVLIEVLKENTTTIKKLNVKKIKERDGK